MSKKSAQPKFIYHGKLYYILQYKLCNTNLVSITLFMISLYQFWKYLWSSIEESAA